MLRSTLRSSIQLAISQVFSPALGRLEDPGTGRSARPRARLARDEGAGQSPPSSPRRSRPPLRAALARPRARRPLLPRSHPRVGHVLPSSAAAGTLTVSSGSAGSVGTVLTGPNGHTLYELTTETASHIMCTGSCAQTWPPLTVSSASQPKLRVGHEGHHRHREQARRHHPGDLRRSTRLLLLADTSAPGRRRAKAVEGVWFAVEPTGATSSTPSDVGSDDVDDSGRLLLLSRTRETRP